MRPSNQRATLVPSLRSGVAVRPSSTWGLDVFEQGGVGGRLAWWNSSTITMSKWSAVARSGRG